MTYLTFLQISDLHLDSALKSGRMGLSPEQVRIRRGELREILPRACDLVRQRKLQAVLIPGDLFDDEAVTQDTVNYVIDHLGALEDIPVLIAPGNHDYYSLGSPYNADLLAARKQRPWPGNVHIFRSTTWETVDFPGLPGVRFVGMAHAAGAALNERLLTRPIPHSSDGNSFDGISVLLFHGSRDNTRIPTTKMRTLPFSDTELSSQAFDYAAIGHYHDCAMIADPSGRILGAYSGCPAGRGLDETGARNVLAGRISRDGERTEVHLEKVGLDRRTIHRLAVNCTGAGHSDALIRKVEEALLAADIPADDMVHVQLTGRIAPGIEARLPEGRFENRYFHLSLDSSLLKPDYDPDRYRDVQLRTTEARFARELLGRIDAEADPDRRRLLESALYYGLDALLQKEVVPRYED